MADLIGQLCDSPFLYITIRPVCFLVVPLIIVIIVFDSIFFPAYNNTGRCIDFKVIFIFTQSCFTFIYIDTVIFFQIQFINISARNLCKDDISCFIFRNQIAVFCTAVISGNIAACCAALLPVPFPELPLFPLFPEGCCTGISSS